MSFFKRSGNRGPSRGRKRSRLLLGQAIRLYLDDRRKAGRRPATLRSYRCHLRGFHRFVLDGQGQEIPVEQAAKMAADYLAYRTDEKCCWDDNPHVSAPDRHLSPASVAVTFRTLRAFFNRLQKLGYLSLEENPFALRLVDCPSTEDKIPSYLREEEICRVRDALEETRLAARNVALFFLLLDTGARIGEILRARLRDLDLDTCILRVVGKRRRHREVPFTTTTAQHLQAYFDSRRDIAPEAPLFLNGIGRPLTYSSARMVLRRVFDRAEIVLDRSGPHVLRHTFGRMYLKNGGDLSSLQQILGHTMISTTTIYARMVTPDLQAKHKRCSPVTALFSAEGDSR
jgi:site-specific recombinase XerD